ncbi:IS66 family insertion sequence element accessory protein TnpA, partial [Enterocloster bolteae]
MASWKAMVQERSASGLSIEEWCAANNVSESQYYYRLRQLRNTALAAAGQTS